jgi:hypothetical protein
MVGPIRDVPGTHELQTQIHHLNLDASALKSFVIDLQLNILRDFHKPSVLYQKVLNIEMLSLETERSR